MIGRARTRRIGLAAVAAALLLATAPASARVGQAPLDVREERQRLLAEREARHQALRGTPEDTQANHRAIDDEIRAKAREAEPRRRAAVREIFERAKVAPPEATGTRIDQPASRGVIGDVDFQSLSARDFERVRQAAVDADYTVKGGGDSFTIEELDVTNHRARARSFAPAGSSASETEAIGRASNKETAIAFGADDPYLSVLDNTKKGGGVLGHDPATWGYDEWTKAGKMAGRNMDAAGVRDPALRSVLERLKMGDSPEAAGVVPDRATPDERARAIRDFHERVQRANAESYTAARQKAVAHETALRERWAAATDPAERVKLKVELIQYREQVLGAKTAVVREVGAAELATLEGEPQARRVLNDGTVVDVDVKTRATRAPSQTSERVLRPSKAAVVETARPPAAAAASRFSRYGGGFLLLAGAIFGGLEGAAQAREEERPDDSFLKTASKGFIYGVWYTTGIPGAWTLGRQSGDEAMAEYHEALRRGEDPSLAAAKAKGVGLALYRMTLDPGVQLAASGGGLGVDLLAQYQAAVDQAAAEGDQADAALGAARRLAAEAEKTAAALRDQVVGLASFAAQAGEMEAHAASVRARVAAVRADLTRLCAEAERLKGSAAPGAGLGVEAAIGADLAEASALADGACRAASQAMADGRRNQISSEGLAFRLENSVRRPVAQAEEKLSAARSRLVALSAGAVSTSALLRRAEQARLEMEGLAVESSGMEISARAMARAVEGRHAAIAAAADRFDRVRSSFVSGVRRFYNVDAARPDRDAEFRALAARVAPLTIDRAALARLDDARRALWSLATPRIDEVEARQAPECAALSTLWDQWRLAALRHLALDEMSREAESRVAAGQACRDRLAGVVTAPVVLPPPSPPQGAPPPPAAPPKPAAAGGGACGKYSVAGLRRLWAEHAEVRKTGKKTVSLDYMFAGECLAACPALAGATAPSDAALQACIDKR